MRCSRRSPWRTRADGTLGAVAQRGALSALRRAECEAYWDSGEPRDKAGAYAIQGLGAVFVEELHGSYSGVMGLPLFETAQLLAAAGVPLWRRRRGPGRREPMVSRQLRCRSRSRPCR